MYNEQVFIQSCYDMLSMIYTVEIDDYEEMKPAICRFIDNLYARFTPNDYKELVQACYSEEQLREYGELSQDVYMKLAIEQKSRICGKILWGFIEICNSECNTIVPMDEDEIEINLDDWD